ncbi:MAG: diaminopimelate decarboxylase [Bacteroidota bacterium]
MELVDNRYSICGIDVLSLCEKYGIPLYLYDTGYMESQFNKMKDAFKVKHLKINYACKALTNINILKVFRSLGAGLDAVSIQEVELALKAGFNPEDIIFTPNCVSIEEISMAAEKGVKINIDDILILEQFGHLHNNIPVCIRINPHIMAGGHEKISTGHIDSKFGISFYQLPHVLRVVEATKLTVEGVHMHTGSDILDAGVFLNGAEMLFSVAKNFKSLKYMDFGSGFKVAYKPEDMSTDISDIGEKLSERFNSFCEETGRELTLMFEPGKFLVSEAGYFLVKVNVIKQTTSTIFAGIDTGLNHLIRPMFYNSYHHVFNISRPNAKPRLYTVVGYICETDTFGWNRKISEITEGDILCFKNAGAYCFSMSSNYNSRLKPAEVMIYKGKDYLITKHETIEDLLRNQVEVEL